MDITEIVAAIDKEISSRTSHRFGIKVGGELYSALGRAGKIEMAVFSLGGTGAYPERLPAYDGKYFIYTDWTLNSDQFEVGTPQ